MSTRIKPLSPGESPDPDVNALLEDGKNGWWEDANMFGVIGRCPELLKSIVPVSVRSLEPVKVEPHIHEMMRLKTGQINDCAY